jgi:hypothetical protein
MKTSNIIFFSLVGSISAIIMAGAIQLRLTGTTDNTRNTSERKLVDAPLKPFKYLVITETTNLQIKEGAQSGLVVTVGKNDPDAIVKHHQAGDTLFIDQLAFGEDGRSLTGTLTVNPATLKFIGATKSSFSIYDVTVDNLEVNLDESRFYADASKNMMLGNISVDAVNSDFSASNVEMDTLNIRLDQSSAYFNNEINKVKAVLKNESSISAPNAGDMEIRKDKTSRIN